MTIVPRQLPAALPHFVGRAAELAALTGLQESATDAPGSAAVTVISGMAGVGKTALAMRFAHQVASRFPGGQLFVDLRGFATVVEPVASAEAIRGFLDSLGVPSVQIPTTPLAQAGLYRSLLVDRRMLIVLDNARDAEQVRPLLPGNPACLVVVTSRSQLAGLVVTGGACPLPLDTLSQAEARELLASRLGERRLADEPEAAEEVIGLCARLPLALAIGAARVATSPSLTLAGFAGAVRASAKRLDAMDAGDVAVSLRAVFSCSYQNLSEHAARMFRLLGLHPGPDITAAAAASLLASPADKSRTLLAELVSWNLVSEHRPGRFALHDLLRAYAAESAAEHDSDEQRHCAVHRVLDHYLHTAHAAAKVLNPHRDTIMLKPPQPGVALESAADYEQAMTWFDAERAVLLAAVDHAAGTGFDLHAWQLPFTLGTFLDRRGHWGEQMKAQQIALAAAERLGDKRAQALIHRSLAHVSGRLDAHEAALARYGQALELFGQLNDKCGQGRVHLGTGSVLGRQGRYREALAHCEQALDLYRAAGDRAWQAVALNNIGWCHAQLREYQHALSHCEHALALHNELGNVLGAATAQDSIGYVQHHLGHYPEAAAAFHKAIAMFRKLDDQLNQADILTHLGDTYLADGKPYQALDTWRQALAILDNLDHPDAEHVRAKLASIGTPPDASQVHAKLTNLGDRALPPTTDLTSS